jgi:succinate dehydrogenase / fumarate reductase membrane anchor subunit
MVKTSTSFTNNGVTDYLLQRLSSLIIGPYVLFIVGFALYHSGADFATWQNLFGQLWMKVFTILTIVCVLIHGYIGLWQVSTDYMKSTAIRLCFQAVVFLGLLTCVIWTFFILWSI